MTVLIALGLPETGLGYTRFFVLCAIVALPGMLLLVWVAPWNGRAEALAQSPSHR
jgi:PAT family beta-lactamase induction signal transducer AmpG